MQSLDEILTPARTVCRADGISKKRLFESIAQIVCTDQPALAYDNVLDHLIAREKLGSTGLGHGIAIPHCRVEECREPMGSLISLKEPLDFDAPDDAPVDLLFVLLVPSEAHQEHLEILADIARLFNGDRFRSALRAARDSQSLYRAACIPIAGSG